MQYSFTYNEVFSAFDDCLKHKRNSIGAMKFRVNEVDNLIQLADDINSFTYQISTSEAFMISDPKIREVFAADFRDRIVHHLVILELKPLFEQYFISHTFACMEGRGVLAGIKTLYNEVDKHSEHYSKPLYLAKLDFKAFFTSIDKRLLCKRLDDFIVQYYPENRKKLCLRFLCRLIILHHPERDCIKKGNLKLWKLLPPHKSMFVVGKKNKGLAIGNLTSQMFANFFLTPLDYFITNTLGLTLYVRYADDFVIGHSDLEYLKICIPLIHQFALNYLLLTIHPDKLYIQECHKGIQFIGAIIKPNRIYCSNRSIAKFYSKLEDVETVDEKVVASSNSYLGLFKHFKTYHIRKQMIKGLPGIQIGKSYEKISLLCQR